MNSQLTSGYQRDRTIERLVEFYNEGNLDAVVKQATGYVKQNPDDHRLLIDWIEYEKL